MNVRIVLAQPVFKERMLIIAEICGALLVGFGSGFFLAGRKLKTALSKLKTIESELEQIEKTEERRVIVPILRVTARIKSLL